MHLLHDKRTRISHISYCFIACARSLVRHQFVRKHTTRSCQLRYDVNAFDMHSEYASSRICLRLRGAQAQALVMQVS